MSSDRPLVVIGAGSFWDGTRLADRHVTETMARRADVLYVDPPMSFRSSRNDPRLAESARQPSLRPIAEGIWRLTPRVPPRNRYRMVAQVASALVARALRGAVRTLGRDPLAVLSVAENVLGVVPGRQVFWARDDFAAGGALMNISTRELERRERAAATKADLAIAVTPSLVAKWEALGVPAVLVPNGVDAALFSEPRPRPLDLPPNGPLVGFCGTLSARIDLDLLHRVVDAGTPLVLLGWPQRTMPKDEVDRLLQRQGVHWLGNKTYEEVPAYLQALDVGLIPYTDSAFNRASFPLKMLEYLAAGLPVVSSDLPAVRYLDTDLVVIEDRDGFAPAVRAAIGARHDPALVQRRMDFAAGHSWQSRVDLICEAIGL